MQYRPLGRSNLKVSALCLGTMTFGEQNTERDAHEQLDRAVAAGVPEKLLPNAARLAKLQEDALKPPKPPKAKSKGRGRPTRMFG